MIRAVLDANTLASGAVASRGTLAMLIDAWQSGRFVVIRSLAILIELERTLGKPYFARRLDPTAVADYLALVRATVAITPIVASTGRVATHPEDDLVLATALSARADYLVTGDIQLQRLGRYREVAIVSPRAFLDVLAPLA